MKILPPVRNVPSDYDALEEMILRLLRDYLYAPVAEGLQIKHKFKNAKMNLVDAIRSERIIYKDGKFSGKFNSTISQQLKDIGAKFNRVTQTFDLPMYKLPGNIRQEVSASVTRFQQMAESINKKIAAVVPEYVADKLKAEKFFESALFKTDEKIRKTLRSIIVTPKISAEGRANLAREYTYNLRKYIQDFSKTEIVSLREDINKQILRGGRYEDLYKVIEKRYVVGKNKARFLARQETGLLMAKFKEQRYKDVGIREYIWRCVTGTAAHPVRPMHKRLDGTKQYWDNPPVTDVSGHQNNPGEDYNCRCVARPIIKFNS